MMRKLVLTAAAVFFTTFAAHAEPIEGNWRTESGESASIAACGADYCVTLTSGAHNGKQIGRMAAQGNGRYKGSITDPADDKTYSGSGTVNGNSLSMRGCVLAVLCRTQQWTRL
jgi:uncharacterized protein (DUF2147 family)